MPADATAFFDARAELEFFEEDLSRALWLFVAQAFRPACRRREADLKGLPYGDLETGRSKPVTADACRSV